MREGEIVGVAGVDGNGQDALVAACARDRARFERGLKALHRTGKAGFARFLDAVCAPLWPAMMDGVHALGIGHSGYLASHTPELSAAISASPCATDVNASPLVTRSSPNFSVNTCTITLLSP